VYTAYFGLKEAPFSIAPDPRYLFMSERHREALAHLLYGIGEGGGFVQLTGEVGTGKTTLCRCLLEQVPPEVDVALIFNPKLTSLELLAAVCDELRVPYPDGTTSLKTLVDALYRHLLDAHARGRRTVLIVDEAQDLSAEVLEQIRLLTNLETIREKLLLVILIGQPELIQLLERDDLRQLAQRVTARYHLLPFAEEETRAYIRHRLDVAGQKGPIFTDGAVRRVHALSGGLPRLINVICDRALLGAYAGEKREVDARTVRRAAREVRGHRTMNSSLRAWRWLAAGSVLAALLVGSWGALTSLDRASHDRAQEPQPPVAAATPAGRARPSALNEVWADASLPGDRLSAFAEVYRRWGLGAAALQAGFECDAARGATLRCAARSGAWNRLRRYNLPAVIELAAPRGTPRYAAVTALGNDTVTLAFGPRELTFALAEVDRYWDGPFVVLWKAAGSGRATINPGDRGDDVAWLRERLGDAGSGASRKVFDEDLRQRVVAFQRSRSLVADGIAGEETLAHLIAATAEPGVPILTPAKTP
jgi:general secretion pathway protein A